jgi:predicted ATPase
VAAVRHTNRWSDKCLAGAAGNRCAPNARAFRPEFEAPWIGRPYVAALTLNRLAERDIEAMIDRVVGNKLIEASTRQDIIERTDGIPLFVEEMTKAVLEAGSEDAAQRTAAAVPSPALAVPASLQASLMARLDRLGSAKEVAQIGAAIGREFSHTLLAAVAPKPEADLGSALDRLIDAGLLFRQGVPPRATYLFKHALVQDAGYGTLLREPRRALHARIAETLESQFADIAENRPELLARHCTDAVLIEKAASLWGRAGQRSLERSALVEAVEQLTRALAQIAALPSTPALRRDEIKLQVALITPLIHVKGYSAPETKAAAERARLLIEQAEALGEPPEDPLLLFSALPAAALAVPTSLQASLMARLDRLGPAKEIAQIGAAIGREFSHSLLAAVVHKPEAELASALDRVIQSGLLFRQGAPPNASYLFKHALIQDAAYGTLLREPRRALHARIAETVENQFAEIAENQPELLARYCTEAGLIEKAAGFWGKAGQRLLERSALVEAIEQLTRGLEQMVTLPSTPSLRREQIKLQAALLNPLGHVKGFAAPETKAAVESARRLVEQAELLGEPPPRLSSVLIGLWVASWNAFDGEAMRELAAQYLALAEKQAAKVSLVIGHRIVGVSLVWTGDIAEGRAHYDKAMAFYDPAEHRPLAARMGLDAGVSVLSQRSVVLWLLGFCEAALKDIDRALKDAREIGHAPTLLDALVFTGTTHFLCGNYAEANEQADETIALADEKGSLFWNAAGMMLQGNSLAMMGKASQAVHLITSGLKALRSTGATASAPQILSDLTRIHTGLDQIDDARRCIGEAIFAAETTKEKIWEAEINRIAGEIALKSPEPQTAEAQSYFARALAVARKQQAKSWELRAAMSMARLWRDQGKREGACELLAPVYGWFTEGFDTRDLKEAKALLDSLAA